MGWTADAIRRIQQQGRYNIAREATAGNDGRKATYAPQLPDVFAMEAEVHPFADLAQDHKILGASRHQFKVRVKGEEMGISPPWDEFTIAAPREPLMIDTRVHLHQAPPLQPVEFRTWEFTPEDAARGKGNR